MLRLVFCFLLAGTSIPWMKAAADKENERTAATLFHSGKYQEALAIWQKMAKPASPGTLYFNIGLAQSNLHQPAEAIYAFEQALRLCPLNKIYNRALAIERKKMENPVIPLHSFFLQRGYVGWITLFRPGVFALLGLFVFLVALISVWMRLRAFPGKLNFPAYTFKWMVTTGVILLITSFLSFHHLYTGDEAIVMKACEMRQASSEESPQLRVLSPGEKVKIKDQIGAWYNVSLLNLDDGWIKKDCIKVIALPGA